MQKASNKTQKQRDILIAGLLVEEHLVLEPCLDGCCVEQLAHEFSQLEIGADQQSASFRSITGRDDRCCAAPDM